MTFYLNLFSRSETMFGFDFIFISFKLLGVRNALRIYKSDDLEASFEVDVIFMGKRLQTLSVM